MNKYLKIFITIMGVFALFTSAICIPIYILIKEGETKLNELRDSAKPYSGHFTETYLPDYNIFILRDNKSGIEYIKTQQGAIVKRETNK